MSWSRTLFKIVALTTIGFVIPVAMLLPVEYALSEFGTGATCLAMGLLAFYAAS